MLKKILATLAALVLLGPVLAGVGIGLLLNPAATFCLDPDDGGNVRVGDVPDELTVETRDGESFTLDKKQLTHAATIIETGSEIDGVGKDGIQIALMAALTESTLRQLANSSTYPESGDYDNDGEGSDHDSLGLFQMRPQSGWGSVKELMDPEYQAQAFFGGPDSPNGGSPRGLLDIPGWEKMSKGEAAQSVEVSAFPDRYDNYEPVAETILDTLSTPNADTARSAGGGAAKPVAAESSRVVFPLPEGTWTPTSPFGPRTHPITGEQESFHTGSDFSAPDGTPILAAADGTVTRAEYTDQGGGQVVIEHRLDGATIATAYIHMWEDGIHVTVGDTVTAGQHIADVGSSGMSTGPHLHFEVHEGGMDGEYTDPAAWLNDHDAADLPEAETDPPEGTDDGCQAEDSQSPGGEPDPVEGDPDQMVDDPTSEGQITARTLHLYEEGTAAFPDTSWACYSPRPGSKSEHPLGRACDITVGNPIGKEPTPAQIEAGWEITNWMKDHANELGVEYLIWQNKIWNINRDDEGWRDYTRGTDVTTKHIDHVHVTTRAGGDA